MQYQMVISAIEQRTRSCDEVINWEAELISIIEVQALKQSIDDIKHLIYICNKILVDKGMDETRCQKELENARDRLLQTMAWCQHLEARNDRLQGRLNAFRSMPGPSNRPC